MEKLPINQLNKINAFIFFIFHETDPKIIKFKKNKLPEAKYIEGYLDFDLDKISIEIDI